MTETTRNLIAATFDDIPHARRAIQSLLASGVDESELGAVLADSAQARHLIEEGPAKSGEAAAIGSAVGGTLFGLAAVALAGPFGVLAAGPMAALLTGAVTGAGAGGLLGALVGLGIPEHEATLRVADIQNGGVIVTCETVDQQRESLARAVFAEHDARDVFTF